MLRVAILDDHPLTLDGYRYRLGQARDIAIVSYARYGNELEPRLAEQPVDVLILDVSVPTAPDNDNAYPILSLLPVILDRYPELVVIVISMHAESGLIKSVMRAGASGYILKEDQETLDKLAEVLRAVAKGDVYLSPLAREQWLKRQTDALEPLTPRQLQALSLSASFPNAGTRDLAVRLTIAPATFRNLMSGAYMRLGVSTRAGAVAEARRRGLIK